MFVIVIMLAVPMASALSVNEVNVKEVSDRYAVIEWETDEAASGKVEFGETSQDLAAAETSSVLVKSHSMIISPLDSAVKYFYNVTSANENGTKTVGPNEFTTAVSDNIAPFIEVDIPEFMNTPENLKIDGKTEPNTDVYVYVNDALSGAGFFTTGNDGLFSLSGIRLRPGINSVRIAAVDPSENRNEIVKIVTVDKSPPDINLNIPAAFGEASLDVEISTNEPVVMSVYLGGNFIETKNITTTAKTTLNFPEDRKYAARFYAVDRAGNVFDRTNVILVDKQPLRLEDENIDDLDPSTVIHRTVRGKTKPGANVVVFVNNKTTNEALTFLKGLKAATNIGIPLLSRTQFADTLRGKSFNYMTAADTNGYFEVEIELENTYRLTEEEAKRLEFQIADVWRNDIEIVVTDAVGRVATSGVKQIYYSRCGAGGLFTISAPIVTPRTVPEPALKQGFAQFAMTMDIKWQYATSREDVEFTSPPRITRQRLSDEDVRTKYNLTMNPTNGIYKTTEVYPNVPLNAEDKQIYAVVHLNPTNIDFGKAATPKELVFTELEFPLMLELEYTYLKMNGEREKATQRKCIDVSVSVEPAFEFERGDAKKFLRKSADFLDAMVEDIDDILDKWIKPAKTYAIYACGGGIVVQFIKSIWTKGTCILTGVSGGDIRNVLKDNTCQVIYTSGKAECKCTDSKYLSCCKSTLSSLSVQNVVNAACDRIFCPSVPTFEKHQKTYSDLITLSPGITRPGELTQGEVQAKVGYAGTKCFPGYTNPSSPSACQTEFQRAWGWSVLFDWPYKNEYEMVYIAHERGAKTAEAIQSFLKSELFINNICAKQDLSEVTIVETGKVIEGQKEAYKIYYLEESTADGKIKIKAKVDYGFYVVTTVTVGKEQELGKITKIGGEDVKQTAAVSQGAYFLTTVSDLQFDEKTGYCNNAECAKAILGQTPADYKKTRLPYPVIARVSTRYSEDYVYNPTGGIISATKAMCLPAMDAYLTNYRNLMAHVSSCFKTIAETGKGKSGACQALLSSLVCDLVVDAVSCSGKIFSNWAKKSSGLGLSVGPTINPFKAVALAGDSVSETLTSRYGETAGFQALFNENALMHSLCVGAFGGDFNLEGIADMLTEVTRVPIKSTCVAFPASRRFISSNPLREGKTTYMYYAGGMLAAGSDISSLSVQLVCSNDNSCNKYDFTRNPRGECDCFGKPNEIAINLPFDTYALSQGEIFDDAVYRTIADQDYRFDKVRIQYTYKDNTGEDRTETCENKLSDDGWTPPTCVWKDGIGFRCEFAVGERGTARFIEPPRPQRIGNEEKVYIAEDSTGLNLYTKVEVSSPDSENPIRKWIRYEIKNQHGMQVFADNFILAEGANELSIPGQAYVIKQSDFSRKATLDQFNIGVLNMGAINVEGKLSTSTISRSFVVIFPTATSYECHDLDERDYIKVAATGSGTDISRINCNQISFRLTNLGVSNIITKDTTIEKEVSLSDFSGRAGSPSVVVVRFVKAEQAVSDLCTDEVQSWSGKATIYHSSSEGDGTKMSSSRVYADGKYQEVPFSFKTSCKVQLTGAAETSPAEKLISFTASPTNVKTDGSLTVTYEVQADKFEKIELMVGTEKQLLVDFNNLPIGSVLRSDMGVLKETRTVDMKSFGLTPKPSYEIFLVINGKEALPTNTKISVS